MIISQQESGSIDVDVELDRGQCLDLLRATSMGRVVVSIQADEFDTTTRTAWSVLVTGTAELESLPEEIVRASTSFRWLPGPDPMFVTVRPILTSGRRFEWNGNLLGGDSRV